MKVDNIFSTPIGMSCLDYSVIVKHRNNLNKIFDNHYDLDYDELGVQTTKDNLHEKNDFSELLQLINDNAKLYSEEVLGIDFNDFKMTGMWSNRHDNNSKHGFHEHSNSFFSGVLYLNVPDSGSSGRIIFKDPRSGKNMMHADFKKDTEFSNKTWWYEPQVGLLIFFPSWLEHGTSLFLNEYNEKRVSLSFNYKLVRCTTHSTMRF